MELGGLLAVSLSLVTIFTASYLQKYLYSFAFFSFFILGVLQVEIFLASDIYNKIEINNFNISRSSLLNTRVIFELINIIGLIFLLIEKNKISDLRKENILIFDIKGILSIFISITIIVVSAILSYGSLETGRPYFAGIGIAIGILMPIAAAQICMSKSKIINISGYIGLINIFYYSRLFTCLLIFIIFLYKVKEYSLKKNTLFKFIILGFILVLLFILSGQIKHKIAQGIPFFEAFFYSLDLKEWFFDFANYDTGLNLGLLSNYIRGVELGSQVADCINEDKFSLANVIATLHDMYRSLFPNFLRPALDIDFDIIDCNIAVVKSPIVDFIRSLGYSGILIYSILLWSYISICEVSISKSTCNFQVMFWSILGTYSIFLIRGSIGAFIAFNIALFFGFLIVNFCIKNNHVR